MRALYIHGFNSAGFGGKTEALREALGAQNVLSLNLPPSPRAAMALLSDLVVRLGGPDFFILGSSLGGFYALNLALRHGVNTLLVNPAVRNVAPGLAYALGELTNYKTGEVCQWTEAELDDLRSLEIADSDWEKLRPHVLAYLDAEDEVLPAPEIAAFLQQQGIETKLYPGGNHQFQHMPELLADLRGRPGFSF